MDNVQIQNGRELSEIIRSLGKIEASLEHILSSLEEQNKRVSWLEAKVNYAAGAIAVLTIIFTFSLDYIKGLFRG